MLDAVVTGFLFSGTFLSGTNAAHHIERLWVCHQSCGVFAPGERLTLFCVAQNERLKGMSSVGEIDQEAAVFFHLGCHKVMSVGQHILARRSQKRAPRGGL